MHIQFGIYNIDRLVEIGGFYVSRFWIAEENGKPVSKKGINASQFGTYDTAGQVNRLRNFVNTSYAKTSFISGVAYDTMLHFVNGKRYSGGYFNVRQTQPRDGISETGSSSAGAVCNIYDLTVTGVFVYTAERFTNGLISSPTVVRGFSNFLGDVGPGHRDLGTWTSNFSYVRATLYVY